MSEPIEVVEYTDPGCSWAWGTEPKLRLLRWRYADRLSWRRVLGGLVGDIRNQVKGEFDPVRAAKRYIPYWGKVYEHTRMTYPVRLKWMYTTTDIQGRAVKAAELQSDECGARVLRRLREQIFVFGEPADDRERIIAAVRGVAGLDEQRFARDLDDDPSEKSFREDWEQTRRPNEYVRTLEGDRPGIGNAKHSEGHWRFAFPTLVFRGSGGEATVAGWEPYERYEDAIRAAGGTTGDARPDPSSDEYFATWPTAGQTELETVCGDGVRPPDGVVTYDWGEGSFFLTRPEAAARGL